MARIRSVKPDFWEDEKVGALSRDARLLWIAIWTHSDDVGRFRADPRLLARQAFPYDPDAVEAVSSGLAALARAGLVRLYSVAGQAYGDTPNFLRHQRIDKPQPSRFPEFTADSKNIPGTLLEDSRNVPGTFPPDWKGGEGKGGERIGEEKEIAKHPRARATPATPASPDPETGPAPSSVPDGTGLPKRKRKIPTTPHAGILEAYSRAVAETYGERPLITPRAAAAVKALLAARPDDRPPELWPAQIVHAVWGYLADHDPWLARAKHALYLLPDRVATYLPPRDWRPEPPRQRTPAPVPAPQPTAAAGTP